MNILQHGNKSIFKPSWGWRIRQEVIRGNCQVLLYTPTHQIPSQPGWGVSLFLPDSFTFFEVLSWWSHWPVMVFSVNKAVTQQGKKPQRSRAAAAAPVMQVQDEPQAATAASAPPWRPGGVSPALRKWWPRAAPPPRDSGLAGPPGGRTAQQVGRRLSSPKHTHAPRAERPAPSPAPRPRLPSQPAPPLSQGSHPLTPTPCAEPGPAPPVTRQGRAGSKMATPPPPPPHSWRGQGAPSRGGLAPEAWLKISRLDYIWFCRIPSRPRALRPAPPRRRAPPRPALRAPPRPAPRTPPRPAPPRPEQHWMEKGRGWPKGTYSAICGARRRRGPANRRI